MCVKVVPNPVSGVLLKTWTQTQRGQCHGMMEAEKAVTHLEAEEWHRPLATPGSWGGTWSHLWRGLRVGVTGWALTCRITLSG